MRRRLTGLLAAWASWLTLGCHHTPPSLPAVQTVPRDTVPGGFLAAADTADITPPLHLSLFGHGPESRVATGVRLRLRCQPFVVASDGKIAAFVPCDLQSSSSNLHVAVAQELRERGVPIPGERVFIMATHTHAGPAHYFEARHYSGPFSSSIPGYDPAVTQFLARQIAASIVRAYQKLTPACIGWKRTSLGDMKLPDMTFNRALVPFLSNQGGAASEPPVDDSLFVLRIDPRRPGATTCDAAAPLGVLAVFGMHPTGVPNTNELYHGDIFGFATRTAEACLDHAVAKKALASLADDGAVCDQSGPPARGGVTVGLANGIEGDVSPKLDVQSVPNARWLGERLGTAIARATAEIGTLRATGPFDATYWELWFPNARYDEDPTHRLCDVADIGMSVAGGAHDGPTRLRVLPEANTGFQLFEPHGCQGVKLAARINDDPSDYDFPRVGSIALIRVGDARLATLPVEVTTTVGRRIRAALVNARADNENLAIVGLTNQYLEYVTTEEEYPFQYYEGASNLYGPHTASFLQRYMLCLDAWRHGEKHDCGGQFPIDHALTHVTSPNPVVSRMPPPEEVPDLFLAHPQPFPSFTDGDRGWEIQFPRMPLDFTDDRGKFSVSVLAGETGETVVDNDEGSSLEVSEVDGSNHDPNRGCVDVGPGDCWRVRWTPELDGAAAALCAHEGARFRIAIRGRYRFESKPFSLVCPATPAPEAPATPAPKTSAPAESKQ